MVTSPGQESSLGDVAVNLATVCAEVGQTVALLSTAIFAASAEGDDESSSSPPLWWLSWPEPQETGTSVEEQRQRLQSEGVRPADVEALLGETGVEGVRRLDLRYFVKHPAQVVIRVPQVIAALRQVVDVVLLEVPDYLTVHHGEGLTPYADVVLVVGERDSTTMDDLRRAKSALTRLAAPVVGVVLTGAHQGEDLWGADSWDWDEYESLDSETSQEGVAESADDTAQVPIVDRFDNHSTGNGSTENGSTENGARRHDSADAVVSRRDSPEA
jgi:hypothetical protein